MEAPKSYAQQDPPKPMNIIVMDCRGLEFIEFSADVRMVGECNTIRFGQADDIGRANGKQWALTAGRNSPA